MANTTETLWATSSLAGDCASPGNAVGATDGTFTTSTGNTSWTHRWAMDDPSLQVMDSTQTINVVARKEAGQAGTPEITAINLYDSGTLVQQIGGPFSITSGSGETVTATFDATDYTGDDANLEIEIVTTAAGGSPGDRTAVQVDSIEWVAQLVIETVFEDVTEDVDASATNRVDFKYALSSTVEPYYADTYVASQSYADDLAEDATGEPELLTAVQGAVADLLEDATGEPELLAATQAAVADLLEDATGEPELLTAVQGAVVDTQEDATGEPELLTATRAAVADRAADADADETILTEEQSSDTGDEFTEEIDREDTILQQVVAYFQDVAEDVTGEPELLTAQKLAADDLAVDVDASPEIVAEQPFYVADVEAAAETHDELLSTLASLVGDEAADVDGSDEVVNTHVAGHTDQAEDVDAKAGLVAKDDIEETAEAYGEVPTDPLREDVTEWVWPRARVAQTYSDDVEEVRAVEVSYRSKLFLDIAVDIDALAELDGEHRDNRADRTAQADAEALVEATISALADLEEEAYIGGAVTSQLGSFYNTLIEDVGADDELTQRLVTDVDLAADADGRDDVAGTAWFKAHSFIEEATAAEELLSETIRRPTKDDVAEDATGDVATLSTVLHAVAAWSEDTLAEDELLGNESGEAWVFNTRTLAFSRYADFEASQVTTVDDEPLAAGARGVMAYSDTRAEGFVKTGLSDYGAPQLKRVRHAYITAASRQPLALSTLHGIGDTLQRTTYQVATLDSTVPYTHRLNLARGDQGQFWAFELRAPAGPPTTLLNLRIIPLVTSRRI